jgi:hypothetical protein
MAETFGDAEVIQKARVPTGAEEQMVDGICV